MNDSPTDARRLWHASAPAWVRGVRNGDVNRSLLLDEPVLELCGDVRGRSVVDVGCGEGRFCRMLAARGARAVGLDVTEPLLAAARLAHPGGAYVRGTAEAIPLASGTLDLAVSYLTLIDIPDFRRAIAEMARVLRPGGRLVIANLQSFATTRDRPWQRDAEGRKLHFAVDDYFDERPMELAWGDLRILNWHRPFEAYVQALLAAGLTLTDFREPRPTPEAVAAHPSMMDEYRVPIFHVMAWRKGGGERPPA